MQQPEIMRTANVYPTRPNQKIKSMPSAQLAKCWRIIRVNMNLRQLVWEFRKPQSDLQIKSTGHALPKRKLKALESDASAWWRKNFWDICKAICIHLAVISRSHKLGLGYILLRQKLVKTKIRTVLIITCLPIHYEHSTTNTAVKHVSLGLRRHMSHS